MWQDSIRNGEFILTNTNRLVRFYDGCNGLKTGSTDKAGFCVSATAKRGNMQLIAVIMGAESSAVRNEEARALLDYGFANFALYERGEEYLENIPVILGKKDNAPIYSAPFSLVVDKSRLSDVELVYEIPEYISAPISSGQKIGQIIYQIDGEQIGKSEIYASEAVEAIKIGGLWLRIVKRIICG
jgi:D-alanyl-D-alanine carboxypeptidase (penicillin-binding protein 5/6)